MKTVGEILQLSTTFLQQKGVNRPRWEAEELLSHVLKLPRVELYLQFDRPLESVELDQLRSFLKKRAEKMPWQYIVEEVEFLACTFEVNPHVLIPRPETEILADWVIKELPPIPVVIWDICSGSGCLGIAIKKKRPDCSIALSDISPHAIQLAKRNKERNQVEVEVRQGDLLAPFQGLKADIIICNPPYVSEEQYKSLDPEVREWEPKIALVGGASGYEFYNRLSQELLSYLNPHAKIYLEIGTGMGEKTKELFLSSGWFCVELFQDWSLHDRFIKLSFSSHCI